MGQNQGKETTSAPSSTSSKAKHKKTIKGRPISSQVSTDQDGSAFTLPWDLRDGGIGNGPSFAGPPPPPVAPPPPPDSPDNQNGGEDVTSKICLIYFSIFFFQIYCSISN